MRPCDPRVAVPLICRYKTKSVKYDPAKHHRRSIRLKNVDYSQSGYYFITVATQKRELLFGEVHHCESRLNEAGRIVQRRGTIYQIISLE
ncbi:MAG TPA: hypothetical protein VHM64_02325 [Candidatus Binatia bacterium]|nr:hypothetical protein [Candidatus Binatia bacterium]